MILLLCLVFNSAPAWLKIFLRQSDVSFVSMCRDEQGSDQLHCIATWTTYKWSISISSTSLVLGLHNNPLHSDLKVDVMEWIYVDLGRVGYSLTLQGP